MKVYKKRLPDGVRKKFAYEKGVKVKILNSKYYSKKKQKKDASNYLTQLCVRILSMVPVTKEGRSPLLGEIF